MKQSYASQAWVVWLLSAAVLTLIARNPLYLLIILAAARIVQYACGRSEAAVKLSFWRLSAVIFTFSILFNFLLVHVGQTVLYVLPRNWWLVGGPLTLEAMIYGALSALVLITLLAVFLAFNSLVPIGDLVSLTPRALSSVGIVVLIAVSYVPQTLQQLGRVREAQALRGHQLRGLRDWQPVVVPLLIGGLERAMNLAETMVARGYGTTLDEHLPSRSRVLLLGALALLAGGWLLSFWSQSLGWSTLLLGGIILVIAYVELGRHSKRTRYKQTEWRATDWLLVGVSLLPLILTFFPFPGIDQRSLPYSPYPRATLPPFDPLLGLAMMLLATPAILEEL